MEIESQQSDITIAVIFLEMNIAEHSITQLLCKMSDKQGFILHNF